MKEKNFYEHIEDLRKIIINSIIVIVLFSVLSYYFSEKIFYFLTKPLNQTLIFITPTETIITLFKLSILVGIIIAFPFILFQIWTFVAEIFNKKQRKTIIKYLIFSLVLFYGAIAFAYFFVLPIVLDFLINFGNLNIIPSLTLSNYIDFVLYLLISFGFIFQFPLVLLALINLNIITIDSLKKKRSYAILIIFIVAAILTPPDAVSQFLLAIPLLILFEITLIIAKFNSKK